MDRNYYTILHAILAGIVDICYTYSGRWKKILTKDEQKELLYQFGTILYPLTDVSYKFIALSLGSQWILLYLKVRFWLLDSTDCNLQLFLGLVSIKQLECLVYSIIMLRSQILDSQSAKNTSLKLIIIIYAIKTCFIL